MNKICVIILGGDLQNICFWPSYYNCVPGLDHDLILVHRNFLGVPDFIDNKNGRLIVENKIKNNIDIPNKAFGAYRYYFNKYKDSYDYFIFISDDVILKRDNWLLDIITNIEKDDFLGFGASQIFNGCKKYPHNSHLRAPFWFAKKYALEKINWEFNSDHDGEMKIADQFVKAGFFGIQVGNKIDLGFDAMEKDHITQLLELKFFTKKSPNIKYNKDELNYFFKTFLSKNEIEIKNSLIVSPYNHINEQNVFIDLEPFDLLIYDKSIINIKNKKLINNIGYNINILNV